MLRLIVIIVGEDFVRIVEMLFCDLCHKYLPRIDHDKDIQSALNEHCLTAGHQSAYYKYEEHHQFNDHSKNSTDIENRRNVSINIQIEMSWFLI